MNENSKKVVIFMITHFLLFIFDIILKNIRKKKAVKGISSEMQEINDKIIVLKQEIDELADKEKTAIYFKKLRQLSELEDKKKKKEEEEIDKIIKQKNEEDKNDSLLSNKILNFFNFNIFGLIAHLLEYIITKNYYFEIEKNEKNENNIIFNWFYEPDKNFDYSLIPLSRILWCETFVLFAIKDLILKIIKK